MKTDNNLFISCEQAKYICDKNQYGDASIIEVIKLNIRLIYCKATRAYSKKNTKLTNVIKTSNLQTLSSSKKKDMKNQLHKKLSK